MTRAVARVTTAALAVLVLALLSLALFADPAMAADASGETASSAVKGDATGFVYAAIAGVVTGVLVFAMSNPGDIDRVDAHHDAPHGDQQMAT